MLSSVKLNPLMWPYPTPEEHDFDKLESTLYEVAFAKVTALLADWFWRWRILKRFFFRYSYVKI